MRILEKVKQKMEKVLWWFRYRFDPRHRYHVINTMDKWGKLNGVTYGWEEVDHQMMYACFKLLVNYVEKQIPFTIIDFDYDEQHKALKKDILDLYGWWTVTRPKERKEVSEGWSKIPKTYPEGGVWRPHPDAKTLLDREAELDKKDDEMLEKLVKIRRSLWT